MSNKSGKELTEYLKTIENERDKEIILLSRKFNENFNRITNDNEDIISFSFKSTDPDYPYEFRKYFIIQFNIPNDYPNQYPKIKIVDGNLPDESKIEMEELIQEKINSYKLGNTFLIQFLRLLDRELGNYVTKALTHKHDDNEDSNNNEWSVRDQIFFDQALQMFPGTLPPSQRWKSIAEHTQKSIEDCVNHYIEIRKMIIEYNNKPIDEDNKKMYFENKKEIPKAPNIPTDIPLPAPNKSLLPSLNISPKPNGTCIEISGLHTQGIGLLYCYTINISVYCGRCSTPQKINLISGKSTKIECKKCKLMLSISYTGCII